MNVFFFFFYCLLLFFFLNQLFQNILSEIPSECQTVWIQISPDLLSGLIWFLTVCQGYQQRTLEEKEFKVFRVQVHITAIEFICQICSSDTHSLDFDYSGSHSLCYFGYQNPSHFDCHQSLGYSGHSHSLGYSGHSRSLDYYFGQFHSYGHSDHLRSPWHSESDNLGYSEIQNSG